MKLHEFIRNARTKAGVTQLQVANVLGVTVNFVSLMERGESAIPMDKLNFIMKFFGIRKESVIRIILKEHKAILMRDLR